MAIHGTSYSLVENNVGFDIIGHMFFVEIGMEKYNSIINNLGVGAIPLLSGMLESDMEPAGFWTAAPNNNWIGNVAVTGSDGWYFQLPKHPIAHSQDIYSKAICSVHDRSPEVTPEVAHRPEMPGKGLAKKVRKRTVEPAEPPEPIRDATSVHTGKEPIEELGARVQTSGGAADPPELRLATKHPPTRRGHGSRLATVGVKVTPCDIEADCTTIKAAMDGCALTRQRSSVSPVRRRRSSSQTSAPVPRCSMASRWTTRMLMTTSPSEKTPSSLQRPRSRSAAPAMTTSLIALARTTRLMMSTSPSGNAPSSLQSPRSQPIPRTWSGSQSSARRIARPGVALSPCGSHRGL